MEFKSGRELWEYLLKETHSHGAGFDLEDWDELPASEQEEWNKLARGEVKKDEVQ